MREITIQELLCQTDQSLIVDARSPSEYAKGHIPHSNSVPLLTDEERKEVGTIYKQESKRKAIRRGLDFFGPKMRTIVERIDVLTDTNDEHLSESRKVVVYCWRGGMRSHILGWLLEIYGFDVQILKGGYKSYRNWCLTQFDSDRKILLLGGYTGSGKTKILQSLHKKGLPIIDLEKLANHKGSAFGGIGLGEQPSQESFENMLAYELKIQSEKGEFIILEDESQRIGLISIPQNLWEQMKRGLLLFIDVPFEKRLNHILEEYGALDRSLLGASIVRLQKKLGGLETKLCLEYLLDKDYKTCFELLLRYYDKLYGKSFEKKKPTLKGFSEYIMKDLNRSNMNELTSAIKEIEWT
jgi:tRNA 2-selenouridine synthase